MVNNFPYNKISALIIFVFLNYSFYKLELFSTEIFYLYGPLYYFPALLISIGLFLNWRDASRSFALLYFFIYIVLNSIAISGGLEFDDRLTITKENLQAIRRALARYYHKHSQYPPATLSGPSGISLSSAKTLETILEENDYLKYGLPNEMLSSTEGSNFVCIVSTLQDFYTDQTSLKTCSYNKSVGKNQSFNGGYLYYPKEGLLRLNYKVKGSNYKVNPQYKLNEQFEFLMPWHTDNSTDKNIYPVQW
ncbi:MAG: hypothetical protein KC646_15755 [Candidatus Cloacimonetes bacterium]|nr:hypothetical protein [Candidatus Cloacimonadota bacterium]